MLYKAVLFDYGDLLARCTCNAETLLRAHKRASSFLSNNGIVVPLDFTPRFDEVIDEYRATRRRSNQEWTLYEIVKRANPTVPAHLIPSVVNIYRRFDHDFFIYADVKEVLPGLANSVPLGIVSDCPHDSLRSELREAGLSGLFTTTTMSFEVGFRKPHPRIYTTACEKHGCSASECLFVSHDAVDLEGATGVGMDTVLVNRDAGEGLLKVKEALK